MIEVTLIMAADPYEFDVRVSDSIGHGRTPGSDQGQHPKAGR